MLSAGTIERERDVINDDQGILFADVEAHNDFEFVGLRQDWQWQIAPDHLLLFGADFRDYRADYDYRRVSALLESMPGVGRVRARQIMEEIGISESRRVRGLGQNQIAALLARFGA